jgi:uncharacterized cupredoxin-like copper-binding protein
VITIDRNAHVASKYQFSPNELVFQLENHGKETHEFHAAEFFKEAAVGDLAVLNADKSEVVLQPGGRKDVYFVVRRPSHYRLYCPDHDWAGMTGEITVK